MVFVAALNGVKLFERTVGQTTEKINNNSCCNDRTNTKEYGKNVSITLTIFCICRVWL